MFIDCSGDGLPGALADAQFELVQELQPATFNFVLTNFDPTRTTRAKVAAIYERTLQEGLLLPGDIRAAARACSAAAAEAS